MLNYCYSLAVYVFWLNLFLTKVTTPLAVAANTRVQLAPWLIDFYCDEITDPGRWRVDLNGNIIHVVNYQPKLLRRFDGEPHMTAAAAGPRSRTSPEPSFPRWNHALSTSCCWKNYRMIIISSPTMNHRNPNAQAAKSSIGAAAAAAPSRFGLLTLVPRTVGEEEERGAGKDWPASGRVVCGQNFLVSRPHEGGANRNRSTRNCEQSLDQSSIGVSRSRAAAAVGATTRMNIVRSAK